MKRTVENLAFDQIYHEHLLYYNLKTIETLLNRHGLALFDAYISPIHGGSVIGFVGHTGKRAKSEKLNQLVAEEARDKSNEFDTYLAFARRVEQMKEENLSSLKKKHTEGKKVFGFGAPVKGNTLLNYFGVGPDLIECLVEKNELRRGLVSPGMHIPVVLEDEITPPDVYYVLAWNFKDEILRNNRDLIETGVFFYLPREQRI